MKKEKVIKSVISVVGVGAIMASMLALASCNKNDNNDSKATTAQPTAASGESQAATGTEAVETEYITAVITNSNGEKETVVVGRKTVKKTDAEKATSVKTTKKATTKKVVATTKKTTPKTTKKPAKTTAKKTNKPKPATTKKVGNKIYEEPDFSKMKFTTKKTSDGGIVIIPGDEPFYEPITVYPTDLWTNWSTSDVQFRLFLSKDSISTYYYYSNETGQWGACINPSN